MSPKMLRAVLLVLSAITVGFGAEGWSIKFFPEQAQAVTVTINGQPALTWVSSEGVVEKDLPALFQGLDTITVTVQVELAGKFGSIDVRWNGASRQIMRVNQLEQCDVSH